MGYLWIGGGLLLSLAGGLLIRRYMIRREDRKAEEFVEELEEESDYQDEVRDGELQEIIDDIRCEADRMEREARARAADREDYREQAARYHEGMTFEVKMAESEAPEDDIEDLPEIEGLDISEADAEEEDDEDGGVYEHEYDDVPPFIITDKSYGAHPLFSTTTLSWDPVNEILRDEDDSIITKVDEWVGIKNLETLSTSDDDVLYVRNERLAVDFEIEKKVEE